MALYEEAAAAGHAGEPSASGSVWLLRTPSRTKQLREGVELSVPAPSSDEDVLTSKGSPAIQEALKKNPADKLLKMAADDLDTLGGVDKEKVKKIKLLMELLDS